MRPEVDDDRARRDTARTLLAAYLEQHHEGRGDFERLCADHPEHAPYFRERLEFLRRAGELDDPASDGEADAPTRVGGFRLVRELGRGGMGVVYEAFDAELGRHVALKVLPQGRRLFGDARLRFEREIAAMGRLSHPNVVTIFRAGLDDDPPHLVMELVRGRSLAAWIEANAGRPPSARTLADVADASDDVEPAPDTRTEEETATNRQDRTYFRRVARWIAETADALEHAHQRGVLHRDVKPGNVLVDERSTARLVDFGVARVVGEASLTATGGFAGTPGYAAPEQVTTAYGPLDARADVYSLGVVLYELLTGRLPFRSEETAQLLQRILNEVPRDPHRVERGVPVDLSVICAKALEKDRDRRYPSAAAMAADLRAFLHDRPIVARPPSFTRRLRRAMRRHALVATSVLGLALVGLSWAVSGALSEAQVWAEERSRAAEEAGDLEREIARLGADLLELARSQRELEDLGATWLEDLPTAEQRARRGTLEAAVRDGRRATAARREALEGRMVRVGSLLGQERYEALRSALHLALLRYARALDNPVWTADLESSLRGLPENHAARAAVEERRTVRVSWGRAAPSALFRYRDEVEILGRFRLPRRLPQPCGLTGEALPFPTIPGWEPGATCFQVERIAATCALDLQPGDLLFAADAVERLDRPAPAPREVVAWRAGRTWTVALPADLDPGFAGFPTQYPLFFDPAHGQRTDAVELSLPRGSYLWLVRAPGHVDLRVPFAVDEEGLSFSVPLHAFEDVPEGFAAIPPGWFVGGGDLGRSYEALPAGIYPLAGFFLARNEVTFGEYLDVLRWADARWPGAVRTLVPEDAHTNPSWPWSIDPETFVIDPPWMAEIPVVALAQRAALQFADLATERARERGEPWIYELPWGMSWEKAARGGDGRVFPWGDEFDWALCAGYASVERLSGISFPLPRAPRDPASLGDESPFSIQGACGNVEELVYRVDRRPPLETPGVKGGGVLRRDAMSYRLPRYVTQNPRPSVGTGFRLVARLPDMPPQGPLGEPLRGPWPARAHD